jgi:hypothetical protein
MRSYAQSVFAVNASTPRKNGKELRDSTARAAAIAGLQIAILFSGFAVIPAGSATLWARNQLVRAGVRLGPNMISV